jgi:peptidoglycan/xylan/chitin deacetylase (PgdA/CDA1 family)
MSRDERDRRTPQAVRAVLTYHSIDSSGSPISCRPEAFERHVEWLRSGRVLVTTVEHLLTLPPSVDAVALTFDDGFVNFEQFAAPRLLAHGLPATVFVVTGRVGRTNAWDGDGGMPELPLMDWAALAQLQAHGVTIGGHTHSHRDLTRIVPTEIEAEVRGCADMIEMQTGTRPTTFAYPYGRCTPDTAAVVSRVFDYACTTEFSTLGSRVAAASIPRLDMYYFQKRGRLEQWGTPQFERFIAFRRGLRRLRRRVAAARMVL